jgi:hypothetical protein
MTHKITADWTTLMHQSQMTAKDYFKAALATIEETGLEFETADVVALAQVMATDFLSTCLVIGLSKLGEDDA